MKNRFSSIWRSEEGLTLLEIMISIVLLSFVMLGVVAIIDNSQNTKDRTVQFDRDNLQIETAMARMEWDFSQIWSPLYYSRKFQGNLDPQNNPGIEEVSYLYDNHPRFRGPSQEGLPIPRFQMREKSDLVFLTTSNRRKLEDQRQSHFMWVRYYLDDITIEADGAGEERSTKALLRQTFSDDPWAKEELAFENTRSATLLENVESLEFAFWSPATRKWETNILSVVDGDSLLRGVQVTIKWKDTNQNERETVRWLRPYWPSVIPQDPIPNMNGGAQGGTIAGAQGGVNGGTTADTQGGNDEDDE